MNAEAIKNITDIFTNDLTDSMPTFVFAIVVLIIGIILSKFAKKASNKFLSKLNLEQVIQGYLSYAIYISCLFVSIMIFLSMIGIPISTIMSLIVIIMLGICLAFKNVLENVGSGLLMIMFKPFKIGDYIETAEIAGIVSDMNLFNTNLKTFDNKTIIVSNSKLTNQNITNYTKQEKRRIDIILNLAYGTDMDEVKSLLNNIFISNSYVLNDEEFLIGIKNFKENGIEVIATSWVNTEDYWNAFYLLTDEIYREFRENKIDMHITTKILYKKEKK